jgi:hypothetical protein
MNFKNISLFAMLFAAGFVGTVVIAEEIDSSEWFKGYMEEKAKKYAEKYPERIKELKDKQKEESTLLEDFLVKSKQVKDLFMDCIRKEEHNRDLPIDEACPDYAEMKNEEAKVVREYFKVSNRVRELRRELGFDEYSEYIESDPSDDELTDAIAEEQD